MAARVDGTPRRSSPGTAELRWRMEAGLRLRAAGLQLQPRSPSTRRPRCQLSGLADHVQMTYSSLGGVVHRGVSTYDREFWMDAFGSWVIKPSLSLEGPWATTLDWSQTNVIRSWTLVTDEQTHKSSESPFWFFFYVFSWSPTGRTPLTGKVKVSLYMKYNYILIDNVK